jgi:hypothetical protein
MPLDEYTELIGKISLLRRARKTMWGLSRVMRLCPSLSLNITSISRSQIRSCFKGTAGKKAEKEYARPTEKKVELILRQELGLSVKDSQRLIKMILGRRYREI